MTATNANQAAGAATITKDPNKYATGVNQTVSATKLTKKTVFPAA
jgi:hypothetical protein